MGGKSGQTIGYRYRHLLFEIWAQHVDTLHRFVAGGKRAWTGCVHENETIQINAPAIWGDDEDNGEGGMVGPMDVQFGLADQPINARMLSILGERQTGNRGWFSTVFEGIFGSYIPNPKTRAVLLERIHAGWPGGEAWYPEKAAIQIVEANGGGASPGGPGIPAGFDFNVGQQVGVSATPSGGFLLDPLMCTLEMAEIYEFTYTPIEGSAFWFWRPNESGLCFVKFGESDEGAVVALVDDGWEVGDTALMKFNSGQLTMVVLTATGAAPAAPDGYTWYAGNAGSSITTSLGAVYLWTHPLEYIGIDAPSEEGGAGACPINSMNPAHIIRYMLTQKKQIPDAMLSDASFEYAADVLFAEGFGLCEEFDPDGETPEAFILRICDIIGACCTQSKTDGLIYLDLLRNDYDKETVPQLTDDDIVDWQDEQAVPAELTNSVQIGWRDVLVDSGLERITPPIKALGHIRTHGREMNQVIDMRSIPFEGIAMRVAKRELDTRSKPLVRLTLTTLRKHTSLRPGQPLLINCPKRGRVDMVVRVGEVDHGTPTDARMRWVLLQDVFDLPATVEIDPTTIHDGDEAPAEADAEVAIEAPYVELVATLPAERMAEVGEESGYLLTGVTAPTRGTNYGIYSKLASESFERRAFADFCPSALTVGTTLPLGSGVQLTSGSLLSRVEVGSWALWEDEIIRVDGIDGDLVLTMGRGCADTVPAKHDPGTRIFFLGDWNGTDQREYAIGDELLVKLPVRTGSDEQPLADKTELQVTFAQRQFRPYPPGSLMLNGEPFYASGAVTTSPPGGGGGGGGGGGVPAGPPKIGPSGVPLSQTPGPNGGFEDNAPYPIPQPTTVGVDIMPGGNFSDPADLAVWRKQDGSALGSQWALVDGELTYEGDRGTAYGYGIRMSLPISPFPRYSVEVTAKITTTLGMRARFGVGWGSDMIPIYIDAADGVDYPSQGTDYPSQTLVTHVFEIPITQAAQHGSSKNFIVTFMPAIEFISDARATSIGKVDDVTLTVTSLVPASTALTPTNLDFSAGLTGWSIYPDPTGNPYAPTISVSGGEVSSTGNSVYFEELRLICDDPITADFEIGKYFGMGGEVWCDDPTLYGSDASNWIPASGVTFGYAINRLDGSYSLNYGCMAERGDWTPREMWMRIKNDLASLPPGWTIHALVTLVATPGYTTKVRGLWTKVTDAVID